MAAIVASDAFYDCVSKPPDKNTQLIRRIIGFPIWLLFLVYSLAAVLIYGIVWLFVDKRPVEPDPAMKKKTTKDSPRVVIIGAGWAGVTAAKHFVLEGYKVTVLEKRDGIGGIWRFSEDKDIVTCMNTTKTTSSAQVSEFSDFPMSNEMGDFPDHDSMLDYLYRYKEHFLDDWPNIEFVFDCEVSKVEKVNGEWVVHASTGDYTADYVSVCTGTHEKPRMDAKDTIFKDYTGKLTHSGEIKRLGPDSSYKNKRVLVFGGGETASDLIHHLVGVASHITWSMPTGGIFQPVYADEMPADTLASFVVMIYSVLGAVFPPEEFVWFDAVDCGNFNGHGIEEFRTKSHLDTTFYNKASESLQYVYSGQVAPRREVKACKGHTVEWSDGTKEFFDEVILCTGYKHTLSFLPEEYHNDTITDWYRFMFSTRDPTLLFIGFARPLLLSLFTVVEQQSKLAVEVISGRVRLPNNLAGCAAHDKEVHARYFANRAGRLQLVHHHGYLMQLGVEAGTAPNFWQLLLTKPVNWVVNLMGPYSGFMFRSNKASQIDTVRYYARHWTLRSMFGTLLLMTGHFLQLHKFQHHFVDPSKGGFFKREAKKFRLKPKLHLLEESEEDSDDEWSSGSGSEYETEEDEDEEAVVQEERLQEKDDDVSSVECRTKQTSAVTNKRLSETLTE